MQWQLVTKKPYLLAIVVICFCFCKKVVSCSAFLQPKRHRSINYYLIYIQSYLLPTKIWSIDTRITFRRIPPSNTLFLSQPLHIQNVSSELITHNHCYNLDPLLVVIFLNFYNIWKIKYCNKIRGQLST